MLTMTGAYKKVKFPEGYKIECKTCFCVPTRMVKRRRFKFIAKTNREVMEWWAQHEHTEFRTEDDIARAWSAILREERQRLHDPELESIAAALRR